MKIIPSTGETPKLTRLATVKFGSAFRFHERPDDITDGEMYSDFSTPYILTTADAPARVVNLANGNTFCVPFNTTYVEVLDNAAVTL